MDQRVERPGISQANPWRMWLIVGVVVFLLLLVGTYAFNWKWTGFGNNTLWDWLELLLLPVVLTVLTVWFSTGRKWRPAWTGGLVAILIVFAVLVVGAYAFNWKWTGFTHNTLWDWIKLLLLPFVLPLLTMWLTTQQNQSSNQTNLWEYDNTPQNSQTNRRV